MTQKLTDLERLAAWNAAHPGRKQAADREFLARNPGYNSTEARKAREGEQAFLEKRRAITRRRRARLMGADESAAAAIRPLVPGELCVYCDAPATEVDHVWPVSRGGDNHPDNLVPACLKCNRSKGSKTLAEWLGFTEPDRAGR